MRTKLRTEDGAAAVEFALIAGVLALLIFGMLQFGLAFFQLQNLRASTREGARVGAVSGTVQDVRTRVETNSNISGLGSSVIVRTRTGGVLSAPVGNAATKPCSPASGPKPDAVRAEIALGSAPQGLQDIFTVDIPLMPTISLMGADIYGEFRCEA